MQNLLTVLILLTFLTSNGQDIYERNVHADVLSYEFHLTLNDANDIIEGTAIAEVQLSEMRPFAFDLIAKSGDYGMEIISVNPRQG